MALLAKSMNYLICGDISQVCRLAAEGIDVDLKPSLLRSFDETKCTFYSNEKSWNKQLKHITALRAFIALLDDVIGKAQSQNCAPATLDSLELSGEGATCGIRNRRAAARHHKPPLFTDQTDYSRLLRRNHYPKQWRNGQGCFMCVQLTCVVWVRDRVAIARVSLRYKSVRAHTKASNMNFRNHV
jgi:hypothetical protein